MDSLLKVGRIFYGVCLIGLGIQQWIYAGFLPVILPAWPEWIPLQNLWAYLFGAILVSVGIAIVAEKRARTLSLYLGGVLLLMTLLFHVPHLIFFNPYGK